MCGNIRKIPEERWYASMTPYILWIKIDTRAELFTAIMNAHTGEIVRRALQENHKGKMKRTVSQVVLH